ncbi:hypothetical protein JHK84_040473 [Glycine max]|nr:hypothetical protein JHK84_040473 [Glycine max]
MEKLASGNSVCEKSWFQSHSRYGMWLHAHYHFSPAASQTTLQVALDYACGFGGADCSAIQPGGSYVASGNSLDVDNDAFRRMVREIASHRLDELQPASDEVISRSITGLKLHMVAPFLA